MAKLGTEAESTVYNTVFIDTSLDTRLAMNVSDTDTVSDLKQKIKVEHPGCFHANGEIKIHALKVKRKGNFYHLSDSMLVKSAFGEGRKNWFLSVDASSLKQHGGNQHLGLGKQDDQLALPWVTASPSEDGSSKRPSLIHQSSLLPVTNMHFANQKVHSVIQSTPGGSCREISTFMEAEDRYSNDNHLNVVNPDDFDRRLVLQVQEKYDVVKEGMISKKRTRDVKHGSSSEVALEHGPAAKKKHKTERKESVKSWEGEKDLISDTNDVKGKAETVKPENSAKDIQQSRDAISNGLVAEPLEGDHFRTSSISGKRKKKKTSRKGEDDSTAPHDQPAKNVSSYAGDVEEERFFDENVETTQTSKTQLDKVPNVSSVLGKNIQQETLTEPFGLSQKEKHDEPVQGMFQGNEVPCSPMRTFVGEHDATTVHGTSGAPQVAPESCIKGTNGFSKKPHKRNKGVVHSSHKTVVSNDQKFEDDVIDNCVEERKLPMNLDSEVNLRNGDMECENTGVGKIKKEKAKKSIAINKDESLLKHANNVVSDIPSTVPDPAFDGHLIDERKKDDSCLSHSERNKTLETKSTDVSNAYASGEGDNVIVNEAEVLQPRERDRDQGNGEVVDEKSRKECGDTGRRKRKEKNPGKSASRNEDVLVAKCADNALSEPKEKENILSLIETKEMLEKKSIDASHVACDREANNVRGNEAEFSQQTETDRNQLNAEDMEEKSRKEYENTRGVKRKKKRANKCAARNEDEIVEHANDTVLGLSSIVPNPASEGHLINKTEKDKSSLSNTEREEIQEEKSLDLSHANVRKETNNVNVYEVKFSQSGEASRSQEKMNDKSRNGKKISRSSTANSLLCFPTEEERNGVDNLQLSELDRTQENTRCLDKGIDRIKARSDLPTKDQEVDLNEFTASNVQVKDIHEMRDMDTISKTKNTGSVKTSDLGQSTGSELEAEKNNGLQIGTSLPEQISEDVLSEVPPSQILDNITKARTEAKVDIDNHVNISKPDGGEIDFMHYLAPADEVKDAKRLDREIKANKNTKNLHAQRYDFKNYSSIQSQETMSKDENNEVILSSKKMLSLVSGDGVKGPSFPDNDQIKTLKESRKIDTLKVSRTSRSAPANKGNSNPLAASSSSSESYHRSPCNQVNNKHQSSLVQSGVVVRKAPTKKTGQVINSSRCVKSLLATPGAIFWDGSDESSADDNGTVNSDASTCTPSNKSSSSGPEGESDSSLDSRRNGSCAAKREEMGGRNVVKSQSRSVGMKNIRLVEILRSSSSFKKAKLNASMEDSESQPVEFVVDSQPDL